MKWEDVTIMGQVDSALQQSGDGEHDNGSEQPTEEYRDKISHHDIIQPGYHDNHVILNDSKVSNHNKISYHSNRENEASEDWESTLEKKWQDMFRKWLAGQQSAPLLHLTTITTQSPDGATNTGDETGEQGDRHARQPQTPNTVPKTRNDELQRKNHRMTGLQSDHICQHLFFNDKITITTTP